MSNDLNHYCLTTMLSDQGVTPVKHYFCGLAKEPGTNISYYEWNPDGRFARRFTSEMMAKNYSKIVLKTEGVKAELHPGNPVAVKQIKQKPLKFNPGLSQNLSNN